MAQILEDGGLARRLEDSGAVATGQLAAIQPRNSPAVPKGCFNGLRLHTLQRCCRSARKSCSSLLIYFSQGFPWKQKEFASILSTKTLHSECNQGHLYEADKANARVNLHSRFRHPSNRIMAIIL